MLKGLTGAGLGFQGSPQQFVELAAKYGFQSVDLDPKSLIASLGEEGAVELLRRHGVRIGSMGLPVEWRTTDDKFREGLPGLVESAAAARKLGCTACCTYILPSTDESPAPFMAAAVRRLRLCAQLLGAYGIRLGLEFVGPHHLRTRWANPFIWTVDDTLEMIAAIGEPNVGLLYDSYHWYTNGLDVDDILRLRADQIVHVHINDAPDIPVEEALDNGRLITGEGVIDLTGFLKALHSIGYTGAIAQEVLQQQPPSEAAEERVARTARQYERLWTSAGL